MEECFRLMEKEYLDYIEGLEDEIRRLKKANAKLKDELEEILKSKDELRRLYYGKQEKWINGDCWILLRKQL